MARRKKAKKTSTKGLRGKYTGFIDPYRESYTTEQLKAYRRKYAKMVNQRLVRLERSGYKITDSPALEFLAKTGRRRFSETLEYKGSRDKLKSEIATLTGFAGSLRSTTEGIKAIVKSTSETIKKNFDIDLDPADMTFLLENFNDFKSAVKMNSDALLQALGEVSGDITNRDQIKDIIKELGRKRTAKSQAQAIYDAMYKGKEGAPPRKEKTAAIREAILK